MNGLDLFSGIGGLSIALEQWVRTICYCEQDRYAQAVLMSRMRDAQLDQAPIWDDVRTLSAANFDSRVDIITAGFPCQDISQAGRGAGLGGERSGLFFEIIRLVDELRPRFIFLENVPAITTRGLGTVVGKFTELGYDCRWTIVSAQELGAPHIRKRWFLLAHPNRLRLREEQRTKLSTGSGSILSDRHGSKESLADAFGEGRRSRKYVASCDLQRRDRSKISEERSRSSSSTRWTPGDWSVEPNVGRVANGIPRRVDRLRCLGNAVVPNQAKEAFMRLSGVK